MHHSTHQVVTRTTVFSTKNLEFAKFCRCEPEIGNHSRNQIHFCAKLRHKKIVEYVFRTQQCFHRHIYRNMNLGRLDENVIQTVRIVVVETKRIPRTDIANVGGA